MEQRIREFEHFLRLESKAARARQGQRTDVGEIFPESHKGRARATAADRVGLSDRNAERGLEVLRALAERKGSENAKDCNEVRELLNNKGVEPAYKQAITLGWLSMPIKKSRQSTTPPKPAQPDACTARLSAGTAFDGSENPTNLEQRNSSALPERSPSAQVVAEAPAAPVVPPAADNRFELADRTIVCLPPAGALSESQLRTGLSRLGPYGRDEHRVMSGTRLAAIQWHFLEIARCLNLLLPNALDEDEKPPVIGALRALADAIETQP